MTDVEEPVQAEEESTPVTSEPPPWTTEIDALARAPIAGGDDPTGEKLYDQAAYEALDAEIKKAPSDHA